MFNLPNSGGGGFDLGNAHGTITIDFSQIGRGLAGANRAFDNSVASIGQNVQRVGQQMSTLGTRLTTGLTVPLVAAGGLMTKVAIDFETAFAGVRKTVDLSEDEFTRLEETLLRMASSPDELTSTLANADVALARIAELAGQLGVEGVDNIAAFTETVALLEVTTNILGEEGALALAQFANITNMPIENIDRLGATIVDLGNNMATTERDILEMAQRLAGAGNIAGLTQDQIFALGAALSSVGIRAEAGGTSISRILLDINSAVETGGDALDNFASVAGMSGEAFAASWRDAPAETLNQFVEGLRRMQEEGGNVTETLDALGFSEVRVRDALLRLIGSENVLADALGIANAAWEENTALTEEAGRRAETTQSTLNQLFNNVRNVARELGEQMAPALQAFAADMIPVLQNIAAWIAENPELVSQILQIAAVAAIAGPVLSVLGTIVSALGAAVAFILSPIGLLIAGIVGILVAAQSLYPGGLVKLFQDATTAAQQLAFLGLFVLNSAAQASKRIIEELIGVIERAISKIEEFAGRVGAGTSGIAGIAGLLSSGQINLGDLINATAAEFRDNGGFAQAGSVNVIGTGAQPELFIPSTSGTFIPNADKLMGGGLTIQNLTISANSYAEGAAAAEGFDARMRQLRRSRDF